MLTPSSTSQSTAYAWRARTPALKDLAHLRELGAIVDPGGEPAVVDRMGHDPLPVRAEDRQDVGEVVLALGVVRGDPLERLDERATGEGVDAGVDLADREQIG